MEKEKKDTIAPESTPNTASMPPMASSRSSASDVERGTVSSQPTSSDDTVAVEKKEAQASMTGNPAPNPPPNGGYGWVITAGQFFINVAGWGIATTFGVFLSYYRKTNYFPDATDLDFAFIGGLSAAAVLWTAPLANLMSERFRIKTPMFIGVALYTASQILAGFSTKIWQLYLTQGLLYGIGLGLVFIPTLPLLAQWFSTKRALAIGICSGGTGAGSLVFSFTTHAAIENLGLRWAFIINAIVTCVILIPSVALMKERNTIRFVPVKYQFWYHRGYLWVWLWGFFSILGYVIALFSLATYSTAGLGLTQSQGATLTALLALGQMIGRPATGYICDRYGRLNFASVFTFIAGLTCLFIWMFARNYGVLIFFALIQGVTGGVFWATAGPVSAEVVGLPHVGSAMGILWLSIAPAALVSEPIALALIDYSSKTLLRQGADSYLICIGFSGACFVFASILLLGAKFVVQGDWKIFKKA